MGVHAQQAQYLIADAPDDESKGIVVGPEAIFADENHGLLTMLAVKPQPAWRLEQTINVLSEGLGISRNAISLAFSAHEEPGVASEYG